MRWGIVILFIVSLSTCFSQKELKLKRRYLGSYKGVIPAYSIDTGLEEIEVAATPILVHLEKEQVSITIGNRTLQGTYDVMFKADKYYLIDAEVNGELAHEKILVYKRGKKISRDGMYPQPVATLKKIKR